ncbi:hypothetical protein SKAU_G00035080 [Synaphobranchus kaupii]|uniref:EF-hand domain-containing protein n=1 Tax=Synaphobranchus kaupii TaxID=118154 RepID=A0A9Q1GEL5_SYNKA|nr:hypothetical protein SKAU_G00035080 [Synaphobranchus kaupii]
MCRLRINCSGWSVLYKKVWPAFTHHRPATDHKQSSLQTALHGPVSPVLSPGAVEKQYTRLFRCSEKIKEVFNPGCQGVHGSDSSLTTGRSGCASIEKDAAEMAAVVPPNLSPQCRAMGVTPRPQSCPKHQGTQRAHSSSKPQGPPRTAEAGDPGRDSRPDSCQSESRYSVRSVPNEALSGVQVDQAISRGVKEKQGVLRAAFQALDTEGNFTVTKGEFRGVIESFILPLTQPQFTALLAKAPRRENGSVSYTEFLRRHCRTPTVRSRFVPQSRQQPMTLKELQHCLRDKMRTSYPDVWRALQVSDVTCSGLVSQEDLKSILSHFLFPISDFLFQGLTSRSGYRGAQFMAQFEDLTQDKRQTSPVRGCAEQQGSGTGQQNLQPLQALQEVYPLLKSSFLMSEQGMNGQVLRAELRRLLEGPKFHLTEQQLKELMILLDPENTGLIHRQRLLELLHPLRANTVETRECTRPTQELRQKNQPTVETDAWITVEGLLRDKLSEHLDQVTEALKQYDRGQNGTVHQDELREVINRYGLPVSEGHFYRLCDPHTDSGRLAYGRFLNSLGVSKKSDETDNAGRAHKATKSIRAQAVENIVLRKLRENLALRNIAIHDCLLETGGNADGTLSLKHFRRMMEDREIDLGQEEFDVLTEALGFKDGTLSQADFLVKYEEKLKEKRVTQLNNCVMEKQPRFLTAEDCLTQMKERIEKHHGDILTAFHLIDRNRDGVVDRADLRRLLDSLIFVTKEQEYQRMLDLLGLKSGATLNYTEFYSAIQACGQPGALPRSTARSKRFVEEAGEQVHSHLVSRARRSWSDMAKAFGHSDGMGNGLIFKNDLRELLYSYALPITANQFEKLWSRYDSDGKGVLTHSEFLEKLGVAPESCGRGQRNQTAEGLSDSRMQGLAGSAPPGPIPEPHPEPIPQRESVEHLSPDRALLRVREEVMASYHTLHKAFSAFDRSGRGTVSSLDFRRVLDHFCVRLSDRQFIHLLTNLPVKEEDHSVPWRAFLERFRLNDQVQTSDDRLGKVEKAGGPVKPRPLPVSDILERIREVVCARIYTVAKEMADLDYAHLNVISKEDFRIFCEQHFMRFTPEQFEGLWKLLPVNNFGNLEYREFLKRFSGDPGEEPQTSETEDPKARSRVPIPTLRRPKTAPCTIGRQKSAEGEELRGDASVAGGGATPQQKSDALGRTVRSSSALDRTVRSSSALDKMVRSSDAVDRTVRSSDAVDRTVRNQIRGCWRELQRRCRDEDTTGSGGIGTDSFLAILQGLSVRMTRSELEQLALKHGIAVNGRVPYADFLRQLLLSLQPRPVSAFHRPKVPVPRTPMNMGVLTGPCADAMLRILDSVRRFWRPMRQSFIACDPTRSGRLSFGGFKQVLGQYGISLSQDEVFHLSSYFDKNLSGKISYNDFLHSFLQ